MNRVRIYASASDFSRAAATLFAACAQAAIRARERFVVALAGGHTPRRAYELLASEPLRDRVDWSRVHVFWGDERCVPPESDYSNQRLAREAFLDRVSVPSEQVHPIVCGHHLIDASACQYETLLREFFAGQAPRFDLILLGLGRDGHTASLFPADAAVSERERWVVAVKDTATPAISSDIHSALAIRAARITLTLPLINQARMIVFMVAGAEKASALKQVLENPNVSTRVPAQLVQPSDGRIVWLVDHGAAERLEHGARSAQAESSPREEVQQ